MDDRGGGGYYSILHHAETLQIDNNPQAVADLVAYVAGEYNTGGLQWLVRPLRKYTRLAVVDVVGCAEEINALAGHFGVIRVDRKKVLNKERQQMLMDCDEREKDLRLQRDRIVYRRWALEKAREALTERQRKVPRTRLQLQEMEERLGALMRVTQ